MQMLFNQLQDRIEGAGNILFVCHKNPDPDTVGSALAMGKYAKSLGKKTDYFCAHRIPDNFLFLKGTGDFSQDKKIFSNDYDLVVFLDCAEKIRCGVDNIELFKKQTWINIDHHILKEKFVDIEIRNPDASATTEIIYEFLTQNKIQINGEIATALLSGILLDTRFLSNAATTDKCIKIAGELVAQGADYRKILQYFHLNKNKDALRLWGAALSRLKHNEEEDLVTTAIFKEDIAGNEFLLEEAISGLSGFLNATLRAKVIMVLQEVEGGVRGSLRTNDDNVNVAKIAEEYGGGGHAKAAGFTCEGEIVEDEEEWRVETSV